MLDGRFRGLGTRPGQAIVCVVFVGKIPHLHSVSVMGPRAIKDRVHDYFQSHNKGNFRKTLKIKVKLILNCLRALAIACLSQTEQNF